MLMCETAVGSAHQLLQALHIDLLYGQRTGAWDSGVDAFLLSLLDA
jgi:hypothetical protein